MQALRTSLATSAGRCFHRSSSFQLHAGHGLTIPIVANSAIAAMRRASRHAAQQSWCNHAWRLPHPIGFKVRPAFRDDRNERSGQTACRDECG